MGGKRGGGLGCLSIYCGQWEHVQVGRTDFVGFVEESIVGEDIINENDAKEQELTGVGGKPVEDNCFELNEARLMLQSDVSVFVVTLATFVKTQPNINLT